MTVYEWYRAFCDHIPESLSAAWDNDGQMCVSDGDAQVTRILLALDVTDAVVDRAIEAGASLIVSHHPLIFSPLCALVPDDAVGGRVIRLLSQKISVFSFHTRLDAVCGGINDALAESLSLSDVSPLGEGEAALGRVGNLKEEMTLSAFCTQVKDTLSAPVLNVWDAHRSIRRVAVVGGEGKDFISAAVASGADVYLSGRLGYHAMQDAPIHLMEAGHYYTERHAPNVLARIAKEISPDIPTEIYAPSPLVIY